MIGCDESPEATCIRLETQRVLAIGLRVEGVDCMDEAVRKDGYLFVSDYYISHPQADYRRCCETISNLKSRAT